MPHLHSSKTILLVLVLAVNESFLLFASHFLTRCLSQIEVVALFFCKCIVPILLSTISHNSIYVFFLNIVTCFSYSVNHFLCIRCTRFASSDSYLYLVISFTWSRNFHAVLSSPTDLLCFHISVDYIFTHITSYMGQHFSSTIRLWLYSPSRR